MPRMRLKTHWSNLLYWMYKYITCEGFYSFFYQYHIRVFLHVLGDKPLNLSYFFYKILHKMAIGVQHGSTNESSILHHHSLIKFLVLIELHKLEGNWKSFLDERGFSQENDVHPPPLANPKNQPSIKEPPKTLLPIWEKPPHKFFPSLRYQSP